MAFKKNLIYWFLEFTSDAFYAPKKLYVFLTLQSWLANSEDIFKTPSNLLCTSTIMYSTSTSISIPGVSLSVGRNDPQRQEKGQYQSFSSFIFSRECIGSPQVSGCPALTRPVMPRLQACCTQSPRHYQPFVSYDCQKS